MRKHISQRIIAGIRMIHVLLLFFMSIITISCGTTHNLSLEESDEEVTESIKNLSNKIEEHRSLEKIVKTKEALVRENDREIGEFEQCIREKDQQVAADIQAADIESGIKGATGCINCNWNSFMTEETLLEYLRKNVPVAKMEI